MQRLPVWPMAVGVAVAMLALEWVTPWLRQETLPKVGLFVLAASLLLTAAMISGLVVRTIYSRVAPGMRRVSTPVVRAACLVALWIPAWVLFIETWSLLMVLAGCVCLASLGVFLKRCAVDEVAAGEGESAVSMKTAPFLLEFPGFGRAMLSSLLLALLAEVAVILMVTHWFVSASFSAGAFAAVVGWRAVQRFSQGGASRPILPGSRQTAMVTMAFVLTVIALLPYLKASPFTGGLGMLRAKATPKRSTAGQGPAEASSSDGYVGIVLLSPKEQHKTVTLPVKREFTSFGVRLVQPLEIPFDGAYWYFKWPDKAPRPTAKVVKGDAAKVTVRSTDRYPLLMEAHQRLDDAIDLGCCSAIDLVVRNADKREGAIVLEFWVRKRGQPATALHYLGTTTIPSSEKPLAMRGPESREESVRFPVPPSMDGIQFDEITVVMRGARERAQFGAQVGLRKFVLEP